MNKLTNNDRELLKSKSAYILPNNPSDKGLSADQIKKRLYEGLMLLFEWLKRAIEDTDNIDKKYEEELKNYVKNVDGIATNLKLQGTITADSQAVINLSNVIKVLIPKPTENNSAIRKLDLDNVNNNLDAKKVNKTNDTLYNPTVSGTLKGDFLLGTQGTADMSPTTKKYTDDKLNDLKSSTSSDLLATKNELQTNINQARQYAEQLINSLINGAPSAFDTLKEIADYISSDQSATSAMLASIQKNAQDILLKANSNDVYTKEEVDNKLDYKANSNDVYKKSETDNLLNKKQDTLKSGENIKTFGGVSILGAGNIPTPESNTTIQVIGNPEGAGTEVLNTLLIGEKIYKIKEGYVNLDIDCDHEYEITGKTGHEYGVAIEDSQMLLKKIQGQTRRYSLNLIKLRSGSLTYESHADATFDVDAGSITITQKSVNTAITYIGSFLSSSSLNLKGTYYLSTNSTDSNIKIRIQYTKNGIVYYDWNTDNPTHTFDGTETNFYGEIMILANHTFYRAQKLFPMINEGSTAEPFQPYDDTLANSKCNLISTGRNLINPNNYLDEYTFNESKFIFQYNYTRTYYVKVPAGKYYIKCDGLNINTSYCIEKPAPDVRLNYYQGSASGKLVITMPFEGYLLVSNAISGTANKQALIDNVMIVHGETEPTEYELYIEDLYQVNTKLGEYDYIDVESKTLVKQTSDIITLDGSADENWIEQPTQEGTNTKLFVINNVDVGAFVSDIAVSNNLGTAYSAVWNNDKVGIGFTTNETNLNQILVRVSKTDINDSSALKSWLNSTPLQFILKRATPTTEQSILPAGYAVYTGGLQQQVIDGKYLPYVLSKEYAVSVSAQIKTNVEIDRAQQAQINEYKSKLSSLEQRLAALEELNTNKII